MTFVLDSSAFLAWLQQEPGWERTEAALAGVAVMHTVNWAEVLSKLAERGINVRETVGVLLERGVLHKTLKLDSGHEQDALRVAELRPLTRAAGLSLGDRYCLALGERLGATVLTADQPWKRLNVGVTVECIR